MSSKKYRTWTGLLALLMACSLILSACGEEEPEVIEKEVTRVVKETVIETVVEKETIKQTVIEKQTVLETVVEKETVVENVIEEVLVTATPEPTKGPAVGGTLVYALPSEPRTLDDQYTSDSYAHTIGFYMGQGLIDKDPVTGEYIPSLATSWVISEDGLVWDFTVREGAKFHDGTPLTAQDFASTVQRLQQSGFASTILSTLISAEAPDDQTLRLTWAVPNAAFMELLSRTTSFYPLSKPYVEAMGDDYGRHPMGVGPFKFKEWRTGEKIVLERNPDYDWGPAYSQGGAPKIQTLEFRIIPEHATILAGLEAGEIDYAYIMPADVERIEGTGRFQIFRGPLMGVDPYVAMNVSQAPFNDVRVRKAFNLAVDRDVLVKVVLNGQGVPQYGPLSAGMQGYWPGVEEIGYGYDLAQAKELMKEAGYTYNQEDMLVKDGQPLRLTLLASVIEDWDKVAEVLQAQYKDLGVDIDIQLLEWGVQEQQLLKGDYEISIAGFVYSEASLMYAMYHSNFIGTLNYGRVSDPELEPMLLGSLVTMDPEERQAILNAAQKRIIEQAYIVPLYTPDNLFALSTRVHDPIFLPRIVSIGGLCLLDAYIVTE